MFISYYKFSSVSKYSTVGNLPVDHKITNYYSGILINFISNFRAVPAEKIWGSLKAKHYIFMGLVGVGFFNPVGGCLS